jgi:hypothetical protein
VSGPIGNTPVLLQAPIDKHEAIISFLMNAPLLNPLVTAWRGCGCQTDCHRVTAKDHERNQPPDCLAIRFGADKLRHVTDRGGLGSLEALRMDPAPVPAHSNDIIQNALGSWIPNMGM